jgi:two-component system sensor histidine kinase KdpD
LKEGKVYLAQQAERAVRNFFRKGNLIALRELALRRTADRIDDEMLQYRRDLSVAPVWQTREALLLCIGPDVRSEKLVRSTARMATQLAVPWHCIYVETPKLQRLPDVARQRIMKLLKLAQDAGAVTATPVGNTLAGTVVRYAHEHNLSRVLLGRDTGRMRRPWRNTLAEAVGKLGADLDVIQIALPAGERDSRGAGAATGTAQDANASIPRAWQPYMWSVAICAAVTLLAAPLNGVLELANIVMLFLLAVVIVAVRLGRGPAVLASFLSVAAFDFFYVPPRFSFSVSDAQYLLTFAVMLAVALVIGQMTAGLKFQARVATLREERVSALYQMSRDLSGALMTEQVEEIAARFLQSEFDARVAVMVADLQDRVTGPAQLSTALAGIDPGIAQWAFDHAEAAGYGTDTLPGSPVLYLPLKAPMRLRGVLAIEPKDPARLMGPEQRRLLDTCASLLAISLERIHYVDVAQSTTVQMESERLRNSLLSAISHDLRTPLAALVGMAESLTMTQPPPSVAQIESVEGISQAAQRMNSLVNNLLDMARLETGEVRLNLQWQPLEEVVGSALKAMGGALGTRPVHVSLAEDLPLLHIDSVLIERVLCNVLENAVKYTPPGSPIEISAVALDDVVQVTVDDHGPGLPKGREEAIFQKFERGRKESATPGVGLGLAICRAIVEVHGGRISAETRPQGGARFAFDLPRGEPPSLDNIEDLKETPA